MRINRFIMADTTKDHDTDNERENDAGSMHSMPLSDLEDVNIDGADGAGASANTSAIDKLQALVEAAQLSPNSRNFDGDDDDEEVPKSDVAMPPAPALTLAKNDSHEKPAASSMLSPFPLSPETPYSASAYYRNAPLSASGMSSIPSAASNMPLFDRSPSPPASFERDVSFGLTRETDGSTSALRDVREFKPGQSTTPNDNVSISSETQRKLRPESVLLPLTKDPLILGIALVDFDHAIGPRIEFSQGKLLEEDEEIIKILPFLALPDGAHLNQEDYSYFHLVPNKPNAQTVFGISCNRQISSSELRVKSEVVTRSTVQKAVVILASKPVFGPIRDKLGVVTRAFFNQLDFTEMDILVDFYNTLEMSLRTQLTESGFYMGTSIRELLHAFRHKTLTLVKALMLQRKVVFFGHPVERLCTYQYSLVSLIPGLLQTLDDCGSPPLAGRAPTLKKPTELKTSDRRSMLDFMGLPLDLFGKDAFFQPYLPLQQIDMLSAQSCLCGSTNSIVTQHKEIDMLVNIETSQIEYRTPHVERMVALTPADRKWIDEVVKDVNDTWNESDPQRPLGMQFKGSDDYLRTKFEEYIAACLSTVKYKGYQMKDGRSVLAPATGNENTSYEDFGELFMSSFQATSAHEVWDRTTDPVLFDIIEPKHPCEDRPNIVSDIGLRLQEGLTDLHLDQQLAPTREAISSAITAGSTSFFKAVGGVRGNVSKMVAQRQASGGIGGIALPTFSSPFSGSNTTTPPAQEAVSSPPPPPSSFPASVMAATGAGGGERKLRPLSLASVASIQSAASTNVTSTENSAGARASGGFSGWGSSIGSFVSSRASKFRESVSSVASGTAGPQTDPRMSLSAASVTAPVATSKVEPKPSTAASSAAPTPSSSPPPQEPKVV